MNEEVTTECDCLPMRLCQVMCFECGRYCCKTKAVYFDINDGEVAFCPEHEWRAKAPVDCSCGEYIGYLHWRKRCSGCNMLVCEYLGHMEADSKNRLTRYICWPCYDKKHKNPNL